MKVGIFLKLQANLSKAYRNTTQSELVGDKNSQIKSKTIQRPTGRGEINFDELVFKQKLGAGGRQFFLIKKKITPQVISFWYCI